MGQCRIKLAIFIFSIIGSKTVMFLNEGPCWCWSSGQHVRLTTRTIQVWIPLRALRRLFKAFGKLYFEPKLWRSIERSFGRWIFNLAQRCCRCSSRTSSNTSLPIYFGIGAPLSHTHSFPLTQTLTLSLLVRHFYLLLTLKLYFSSSMANIVSTYLKILQTMCIFNSFNVHRYIEFK